jgi:hypothetical protein
MFMDMDMNKVTEKYNDHLNASQFNSNLVGSDTSEEITGGYQTPLN